MHFANDDTIFRAKNDILVSWTKKKILCLCRAGLFKGWPHSSIDHSLVFTELQSVYSLSSGP